MKVRRGHVGCPALSTRVVRERQPCLHVRKLALSGRRWPLTRASAAEATRWWNCHTPTTRRHPSQPAVACSLALCEQCTPIVHACVKFCQYSCHGTYVEVHGYIHVYIRTVGKFLACMHSTGKHHRGRQAQHLFFFPCTHNWCLRSSASAWVSVDLGPVICLAVRRALFRTF